MSLHFETFVGAHVLRIIGHSNGRVNEAILSWQPLGPLLKVKLLLGYM